MMRFGVNNVPIPAPSHVVIIEDGLPADTGLTVILWNWQIIYPTAQHCRS